MGKAKNVSKKSQKVFIGASGMKTPKRELSWDPNNVPTLPNIIRMLGEYEILYESHKKTFISKSGYFRKLLEKKNCSHLHLRVLMDLIRNEIAYLRRIKLK